MQYINNKLHDLLATLQEMQKLENNVISHLLTIENKQDTIIELLRTIAAK